MIGTILWDHDGVLVDTERLYYRATRDVLARFGVDLSVEHYRQFHLVEARGSWHLLESRGMSRETVEGLRRERNDLYLKMLLETDVLVPGAVELLRRLAKRYRMAVVTSSNREHFEAIHRHTGLPELMQFVLAREDYGECKPHAEPYLCALERFGAARDECVVVEDSTRGLSSAKAAGLRCWIVHSEMTEGLNFAGAERQFANLAGVGEALLCPPEGASGQLLE